jgi:dolichyl-diphosphooligosaccharide--protein glycosyltransferase/undecaprenyl-diphosphooligosaccharide--protein glycosyltransferase
VLGAMILMIVNIFRTNPSFTPSYFLKNDVMALKKFKEISTKRDLLVSWWDYGWPLWYYTERDNTLIDNGLHDADTYLVAKLLLAKSDKFVANALRYFGENPYNDTQVLARFAKKENLQERFKMLENTTLDKKKTRDIYFMIHRDMLLTFNMFEQIANIDLKTGKNEGNYSQLYISDLLKPYSKRDPIVHGDTFNFDLRNGVIKGADGAQMQIHGVIISENSKLVAAKAYNRKSNMNLVIYNRVKAIYLDNRALNTFLVKALLLDRYDKNLFEKVIETPSFKIFKLK